MFDLTSSKLLILAVVALIVVGPKDLPALLRTVGRYMGMIRRQANEFRAQFEEAMRETELAELKKEVETLGKETQETLREAGRTVETQVGDLNRELGHTMAEVERAAEPAPAPPEDQVVPETALAEVERLNDRAEVPPALVAPPAAQPRETVAVERGPPASGG